MKTEIYDLKFTVRGVWTKDIKALEKEVARIQNVIEAVLNSASDAAVEQFWYIANDIKKVEV